MEFELVRTTLGPGVDAGVFLPHAPGSREYGRRERKVGKLSSHDKKILLGTIDAFLSKVS